MSEQLKIKRCVYKTTKYQLNFFMYLPQIDILKNNVNVISYNPVLSLQYMNSGSYSEDFSTIGDRTFKITPRNIYHVLKFFNTIIEWFYDKEKPDLFLYNEDNELVFNSDYKDLVAYTKKTSVDNSTLKAIPTVAIYNDKRYEGIYLYINQSQYDILMTIDEVETLFGLLKDFSFYQEILLCLYITEYSKTNQLSSSNNNKMTDYANIKTPFDI